MTPDRIRSTARVLFRQVAVVHEAEPDRRIGIYPRPTVVRLVSYVVTRWRHSRGPVWSRAGVLARDRHACAYCGGTAATIDHVLPGSRGGANEWTNTVAACGRCNNRKGRKFLALAALVEEHRPIEGTHKHRTEPAIGDEVAYKPTDIPEVPHAPRVAQGTYRAIFEAFAGECYVEIGPDFVWLEPCGGGYEQRERRGGDPCVPSTTTPSRARAATGCSSIFL